MKKHHTVKELPDTERPYEKCFEKGAEYLSDAELLAVILRTGAVGIQSLDLAKELLGYQDRGLLNLYSMSKEEMMKFEGIGKVKAIQLKCIAELSKRISCQNARKSITLDNAKSVADYYMEQMCHEPKEKLIVSLFSNSGKLITEQTVSVGTIDSSYVSPREIFYAAINHNAAYIILLHNHPSGDSRPSTSDIQITRRLQSCGELMNIPIADHIIIGEHCYYSFRENGQL